MGKGLLPGPIFGSARHAACRPGAERTLVKEKHR